MNTGRISGSTNWVETAPVALTDELMARGQQRYNIHCLPCHGAAGDGKGITSKNAAWWQWPTFTMLAWSP